MRKQIANVVYIIQNLAVPVLVYVFVLQDLYVLAYATVLLSKWRVFAISPRFWLANIRSNLCDYIVGLSTVALMSHAPFAPSVYVNIILAVLYAVWLIFIKPQSGKAMVSLQAFICQLYGLTTLYLLVDTTITSVTWIVIVLAWIVGRAVARHFLSAYPDTENKPMLISLWSFLIAQLAWVFWVWNVIYLPGSVFSIPLIGLIASVLAYAVGSIFHMQYADKLQRRFVVQQGLFVSVVLFLVILFTRWTGQV